MGSSISVCREVQKFLIAETGVLLQISSSGVDLGVDCGGARRNVQHQLAREAKADTRNERVKFLTSFARGGEKLVTTGTDPMRSYGFEVMGMAPTRVQNWRSSNASARGGAKCLQHGCFGAQGGGARPRNVRAIAPTEVLV